MGDFKFKIGDKVKILDGSKIDGYAGGWIESSMQEYCGKIAEVHSSGKTSSGKNYYTLKSDSKGLINLLIFDERGIKSADEERKIVITTDGTTTRAALYDGHKLIGEAKAKCSKDDTFNFETGAKIALDRLTEKPAEPKPKKALKLLNTRIFILDGDDAIKSSHIYEIKYGKIVGSDGGTYPCNGNFYNIDDVVNYLKPDRLRIGAEKYDSNGERLSEFNSLKQITVMEVKEDD